MSENGVVLWMTGLSGAGKTTISNMLCEKVENIYNLDGDKLRDGLNEDCGFDAVGRKENIRRAAHVAKLFSDQNFTVVSSFITPYKSIRQMAKKIIGEDRFLEVHIKCSLEECKKRDVKGLYKKVEDGEIKNFTGITDPYEVPESPDIVLDTENSSVEECVDVLIEYVTKYYE